LVYAYVIIDNGYQYQLGRLVTSQNTQRIEQWLEKLQASGYRLTGPRQAVVEILAESQFTLDATQVFLQSRQNYPSIGLVTIYRTLEKLEEVGLILRVHQSNGCHSFIAAPQGHQHLLICSACRRAEYFSGDNLAPLMTTIGEERGFSIQEHWLQLFGLCSNCQNLQVAEKKGGL
jgi:Fe2+/Zn2+ uptake regulation proteins